VFRDGKAPQITSLFGSTFLILREIICVTTVNEGFYSKVFVIQPPIILEITYLKPSFASLISLNQAILKADRCIGLNLDSLSVDRARVLSHRYLLMQKGLS
jgi:hypothetical protein